MHPRTPEWSASWARWTTSPYHLEKSSDWGVSLCGVAGVWSWLTRISVLGVARGGMDEATLRPPRRIRRRCPAFRAGRALGRQYRERSGVGQARRVRADLRASGGGGARQEAIERG